MMDLRSYPPEELAVWLADAGEPAFRAKQLFGWLQRGTEPAEMTNLPGALRARLAAELPAMPEIQAVHRSEKDDTEKLLVRLGDGELVEGVLMRYHHGVTLCLSTQVGCAMGCAFCASTLEGKKRNLSASEMLGQVWAANRHLASDGVIPEVERSKASDEGSAQRSASAKSALAEGRRAGRIHNVVLMGSGEPLDNYEATVRFLQLLRHPEGLNLGLRNVSLSTCGLVPQMRAFAKEGLPVTLSVSLHAADDATRRAIMPVAQTYPIAEVLEVCRFYIEQTGRRVIFEYALIEGVNAEEEDARRLAGLLRGMQCHVNLIPLNPVPERALHAPTEAKAKDFLQTLERLHISATRRREMGQDIAGACGQLRRRHEVDVGGTK